MLSWHHLQPARLRILAYSRPKGEGFVTSSHDVADGTSMRWHIAFFNPGSNTAQQSWLRVVNISGIDTEVTIEGLDDNGAAGTGVVSFDLPADAARMLSAQELERGYSAGTSDFEFEGRLGDGHNKWQLFVSASRPIQVMSLLLGQSGNLTNLSTVTRDAIIRGGPDDDELWGGNGDDMLSPGRNDLTRLRLRPTRHVAPFLGARASCPHEQSRAFGPLRARCPRSQGTAPAELGSNGKINSAQGV